MTAREFMDFAWYKRGRPTDLDPSTVAGRALLLSYLNVAYKTVATWKDKVTGARFRWRGHTKDFFGKPIFSTGTLDIGTTASAPVIQTSSLQSPTEDLTNAHIVVGNERRYITSNAGITLALNEDFSSLAAGQAYTIYRDWVDVPAGVKLHEVLQVNDTADKRQLDQNPEWEFNISNFLITGTPSEYKRVGKKIRFDRMPEVDTLYQVIYYRLPNALVLDTDESELPEVADEAVTLYLEKIIAEHMQEPDAAYAMYNTYVDRFRTMLLEYDIESEGTGDYPSSAIFE